MSGRRGRPPANILIPLENNDCATTLPQTVFGRPFVKRFALCYQTVVCPVLSALSCLSVALVCCGRTVLRIKMKLGTRVGLGPGHIVLDGDPAPPPQKGTAPQFSAHIRCGQMAAQIKMPLVMEVGIGPGDFVLDGDPAPLPKKGAEPPHNLLAHFYCGQTAGCTKIPLGMEIGLSPGHFVLDGDTPPPHKGSRAPSPIFGPCLLWPNS